MRPILDHLAGRLKEPSCWAGFAGAFTLTATQLTELHVVCYIAAGACTLAAILVTSGGSQK